MKFTDRLNALIGGDYTYMKPKQEEPRKVANIKVIPSPKKVVPKQYGDKGYKPSNGKGVGM